MEELCRRLRGSVDLVLGGHTLACHAGSLAGVPLLQPWAFGSQVAVAHLHEDGSVGVQLADVGAPRPWTGVGAGAQEALEAEVVGRLEEPLLQAAGRACTLAEAVAAGVLQADEALDAVYVGHADIWNQPARDGVGAFLGAGDVSRAQVLRLTPFCGGRSAWGGQLVAAELSGPDGEQAMAALEPGAIAKRPGRRPRTLALTPFSPATADRAAGRRHEWHGIEATLRDGLMDAVTR